MPIILHPVTLTLSVDTGLYIKSDRYQLSYFVGVEAQVIINKY